MLKYIILALVIIFWGSINKGQPLPDLREEINVYEQLYDAPLHLINGENSSIRQLASNKPLIIALIFTRCSGICSPLLLQLRENLKNTPIDDNSQFTVLVVSFDPRDSLKDMIWMAGRFGLVDNNDWRFAVTDSINQLISSIGFNPVWDDKSQQFDHDALLVGVNSEGYITKKLIGMRDEHEIGLLISSINNIYLPTYRLPGSNNLFSCFNYDPRTGKNKPGLGLLFIALPALISFSLVFGIRFIVRRKAV